MYEPLALHGFFDTLASPSTTAYFISQRLLSLPLFGLFSLLYTIK